MTRRQKNLIADVRTASVCRSCTGFDARGHLQSDMKTALRASGFRVQWRALPWVGRFGLVLLSVTLGSILQDAVSGQTNVSLEVVGRWSLPDVRGLSGVTAAGNHVFVCASGGLDIINVSDPSAPTRIARATMNTLVNEVRITANHAFAACRGEGVQIGGLQVVDITDLQAPKRVAGVTDGFAAGIDIQGQFAYVAEEFRGLEIFDISQPARPVLISRMDPGGRSTGVRVITETAYLTTADQGLFAIDVSDPAQPVVVGRSSDSADFGEIDVTGNHAFLASFLRGTRILDISDRARPRLANTMTNGLPISLRVAANRLYQSDDKGGIQVLDISDPVRPVVVGSARLPGPSWSVDVDGSYAFVTSGLELIIMRMTEKLLGYVEQPESLELETGQTAVFSAPAVSVAAFIYQWQKDGAPLLDDARIQGSTTATLRIANTMASDQGCYSAIVSNTFGVLVSSNACLTVRPGMREALDDPNLVWSQTSSPLKTPWRLQFIESIDGQDAAECGPLQAGETGAECALHTRVDGPGTISFWWKLETAAAFIFVFQGGGNEVTSRANHWQQQIVRIAAGEQDLAWRFIDRGGEGHPSSRAWIDQVRYVPDTSKVGIGLSVQSLTNDLLRMLLIGPAETRVGLETSPDLVSWSPLPLSPVTLSTGRDVVEVPRPSTTLFYRAAPPP